MDDRRQEAGVRERREAGVALVVLGVVVLAVVAFTTPWRALPPGTVPAPDPARDFTPLQLARAAAFDAATGPPGYLSYGLGLLFAGLLVLTPFGARLLGRLRGPWWLRVLAGVLLLTAILQAVRWPLGVWYEIRLREWGLSTQDWAAWTGDRLKGLGVSVVLTSIMVLAVVALARRVRRWWIPAAAGAFALTVAASFVYPVVFEPLFNDFRPMPDGPLRTALLAMAERDGVPVDDVLVADASRRTTALNAYVSGFGATRRIVVYDTLLTTPRPEVELVVAHELGHAAHDDVLSGTLVGALGAATGAVLLFALSGLVRRRTGIASMADPRAAGVLLGLVSLAGVLSGPAQNVVSRHVEARADVHALDLTRAPATFVAMQNRLASANLSDLSPDVVEYVLYASHPTAPERIALARAWARLNGVPEP
ncbi:M48 family metallopeptidase [Nonomuraea muscovyensis]|uniref:STE24 endopeptidase n=1 Tax=Nonomuraea muscovyensis TaxID=1124761 RepID=A0A7X0BWC0_9ACTN|nr:M48 family metallopeptidase [Nonomuraea muscovyensis]MBB6344124.1 STE24 endopeptidase [Nonomuraea muscovyensis]